MSFKKTIIILSSIALLAACGPSKSLSSSKGDYLPKYQSYLSEGASMVSAKYHSFVEKLPDGRYRETIFNPDKKVKTLMTTYADKELKKKEGPMKSWTDAGVLWFEGEHKNGFRTGIWKTYDIKTGKLSIESNYEKGTEPSNTFYNAAGEVVKESAAKMLDSDVLPYPAFEECAKLEAAKIPDCSSAKITPTLFKYVQYPARAKELEIEGTVWLQFNINEQGKMVDMETIQGVCDELEAESKKAIRKLPNWVAGQKNGQKIKVQMRLPLKFMLK